MSEPGQMDSHVVNELVRVSVIVRDDRGFTHYYEDVMTTPGAVRDAFDLMIRCAPTVAKSA